MFCVMTMDCVQGANVGPCEVQPKKRLFSFTKELEVSQVVSHVDIQFRTGQM